MNPISPTPSILGNVFGILLHTQNQAACIDFYTRLGFAEQDCESHVHLSDGIISLYLNPIGLTELGQRNKREILFFLPELIILQQRLKELNIDYIIDNNFQLGQSLILTTPDEQILRVVQGNFTTLQPKFDLQAGMFGEYAMPVSNYTDAVTFWRKLGFQSTFEGGSPYNWGIVTDGYFPFGLHETSEADPMVYPYFKKPALTYFAAQMQTRIQDLKSNGVEFASIFPASESIPEGNAILLDPDTQPIFLFHWAES